MGASRDLTVVEVGWSTTGEPTDGPGSAGCGAGTSGPRFSTATADESRAQEGEVPAGWTETAGDSSGTSGPGSSATVGRVRARNWAADDEERAFAGVLADRAGSAGEGTGTFVPGVGVKGTPVWGEEEGKEMKGRGKPEEDGTGMRSSRLSDGGGGGMGKGSSRSSADGEMNFRRVLTLRRWRVKLRV